LRTLNNAADEILRFAQRADNLEVIMEEIPKKPNMLKKTVSKLIVTICYQSIVLKVSRLSVQDSGVNFLSLTERRNVRD
jgi:hypothetical protein